MRKLLFSRDSECVQPIRSLVERQTHRTLVLWALDCAVKYLDMFEERFPSEPRPRQLLEIADLWARGEVKMPAAKKAIHAAHEAASLAEGEPAAEAAARAVAHAASAIHVETHALGLVFYGLTAVVYSNKPSDRDAAVEAELKRLYERLKYFEENPHEVGQRPWAEFLKNDKMPNKEALLREKLEQKAKEKNQAADKK